MGLYSHYCTLTIYLSIQVTDCCVKFSKYQIDMIEENIKLYDCMKASEKQFIQEVLCTCIISCTLYMLRVLIMVYA